MFFSIPRFCDGMIQFMWLSIYVRTLQEVQCVGFEIISYIKNFLYFERRCLIDLITLGSKSNRNKVCVCVCVCVCLHTHMHAYKQALMYVCICACIQLHNMIKFIRILTGSFWNCNLTCTFFFFFSVKPFLLFRKKIPHYKTST